MSGSTGAMFTGWRLIGSAVLALWLAGGACGGAAEAPGEPAPAKEAVMAFSLESPAFAHGAAIRAEHTCDGEDVSPELRWGDAPEGTVSFALICDDPDAPVGTWVHWLIWNIPADRSGLPRAVPPDAELPDLGGARQGRNDFGRLGYGGPCPPPGKPHRYFFRLYALGRVLELPSGATRAELERAMEGHVLGRAELMGTYARRR